MSDHDDGEPEGSWNKFNPPFNRFCGKCGAGVEEATMRDAVITIHGSFEEKDPEEGIQAFDIQVKDVVLCHGCIRKVFDQLFAIASEVGGDAVSSIG